MKNKAVFIYLILLTIPACSKQHQTCMDNEMIIDIDGEFRLENNVWGKKDIKDYKQCIYREKGFWSQSFGWNWSWPVHQGHVKAYPEIVYGWKPLGPYRDITTTKKLPKKLSELKEIRVDYDIESHGNGKFNTAFELWLTKTNKPQRSTITREIMVWINNHNWSTMDVDGEGLRLLNKVAIDGTGYNLYTGTVNTGTWTYFSFVNTGKKQQNTIDLKKFLVYLTNAGFINEDEYVACIELGNEVVYGSGKTKLTEFAVTVK